MYQQQKKENETGRESIGGRETLHLCLSSPQPADHPLYETVMVEDPLLSYPSVERIM
jgi:hypothetical protein